MIEQELLLGIQHMAEGQEEGFNIVYSHTYSYVYKRARYIMQNEQDALDLTQDTYIQAYRKINTLEDANNIYAWLGAIVYRQGMQIFRKRKEVLLDEEASFIFDDIVSEDNDYSPEENAETQATASIIMEMIDELPELQRMAIMAFYYDNMKIDDIAAQLGCSSNTIKSRLNYAKKFLKEKVTEHEKKNHYTLHSLTPAIFLLAYKSLFATERYTVSASIAQNIYNASCGSLGIMPTAISAAGTTSSVVSQTITAEATRSGLSLGTKIGITALGVITAGSIAAGVILSNKPTPSEENNFTEAPTTTTPVPSETVSPSPLPTTEPERVSTKLGGDAYVDRVIMKLDATQDFQNGDFAYKEVLCSDLFNDLRSFGYITDFVFAIQKDKTILVKFTYKNGQEGCYYIDYTFTEDELRVYEYGMTNSLIECELRASIEADYTRFHSNQIRIALDNAIKRGVITNYTMEADGVTYTTPDGMVTTYNYRYYPSNIIDSYIFTGEDKLILQE